MNTETKQRQIACTEKGLALLARIEKEGSAPAPNHIAVLSVLRDDKWHLFSKIQYLLEVHHKMVDFNECIEWLLRNKYIEIMTLKEIDKQTEAEMKEIYDWLHDRPHTTTEGAREFLKSIGIDPEKAGIPKADN